MNVITQNLSFFWKPRLNYGYMYINDYDDNNYDSGLYGYGSDDDISFCVCLIKFGLTLQVL